MKNSSTIDKDHRAGDFPDWSLHTYPAVCQDSDGNWYGLNSPTKSPQYQEDWKSGKELSLPNEDGDFLCRGVSNYRCYESHLKRPEVAEISGKAVSGHLPIYDITESATLSAVHLIRLVRAQGLDKVREDYPECFLGGEGGIARYELEYKLTSYFMDQFGNTVAYINVYE